MTEPNLDQSAAAAAPAAVRGSARSTAGLPLQVQVVSSAEAFRSLREAWQTLQDESACTAVFCGWEWLYSWWEVFGSADRELHIVCVYAGDDLVGLAPLHLHKSLWLGATLRWIGTGEAACDEVVSEYLDVIARRGSEAGVVSAIATHLGASAAWSSIVLNDAVAGQLSVQLVDALSPRFATESLQTGYRYAVPLGDAPESTLSRLSSSRRKRLARCRNAIAKDAGALERLSIASDADVVRHLDVIKQLHSERWAGRRGGDVFDSEKFYRFHQRVIERLWSRGKAAIEIYTLNGNPVCALHLYYSRGTCHYYQSGFSTVGGNRYMPLFVSHMAEMDQSRCRGLSVYDFMRGPETSYKADFGCERTAMYNTIVYRRTVAKVAQQTKRRIRRVGGNAMRTAQLVLAWVTAAALD